MFIVSYSRDFDFQMHDYCNTASADFFCNFYVTIGLHDANSLIGGTFGMSRGLVKRVTEQKMMCFLLMLNGKPIGGEVLSLYKMTWRKAACAD